jgi:hypothetical protein
MIELDMTVDIHMNLLGVLLRPVTVGGRIWPDAELSIFNWKTAQKVAVGVINTTED